MRLPPKQVPCQSPPNNLRIFLVAHKPLPNLNLSLSNLADIPLLWEDMFFLSRPYLGHAI